MKANTYIDSRLTTVLKVATLINNFPVYFESYRPDHKVFTDATHNKCFITEAMCDMDQVETNYMKGSLTNYGKLCYQKHFNGAKITAYKNKKNR